MRSDGAMDLVSKVSKAESLVGALRDLTASLKHIGVLGLSVGAATFWHKARPLGVGDDYFLAHTYPEEWETSVLNRFGFGADPTVAYLLAGRTQVSWSDPDLAIGLGGTQVTAMKHENDIGMVFGVSFLADVPRSILTTGMGFWLDARSHAEEQVLFAANADVFHAVAVAVDALIRRGLLDGLVDLSRREMDLLELLVLGYRADEIAHRMGISVKTLEKHVKGCKAALKARTRDEMVAKAVALGLIR